MLDTIIETIIHWLEHIISSTGSMGIMVLMALESCNIPIPSEATLPFGGYLVSKGELNFHVVVWASALGCLIGSFVSYYIGYFGGRRFIEKYGKYFFVTEQDLNDADKWVEKYGDWAFFICRMLPIIRTFISLPAGILHARKRVFFILTFVGSLIWSYALCYVGYKMGEHMDKVVAIWHKFDVIIVIICCALFVWYIYSHIKKMKKT